MTDFVSKFLDAMAAVGIRPSKCTIEPDGTLHRFHVDGDSRGTLNGWYVLHADGIPAGEFGSWKTNYSQKWCERDQSTLTPEEARHIAERYELAKAQRAADRRKREGEAAKAANLLWQEATPLDGDGHPYLKRKGVRSHGLRVGSWPLRGADGEVYRQVENTLLIPVMDARGRIMSLQAIFPESVGRGRDKDFMSGGRKGGGFFLLGTPPRPGEEIVICEGYATGATIHEATGWCVAVCFDAGNMPKVAEEIRETMPDAEIVIAADNDAWTKPTAENPNVIDNPGVTFARRAQHEVGGRLVVPQFTQRQIDGWRGEHGKSVDTGPTDFNDLQEVAGGDVVQAQLWPPKAEREIVTIDAVTDSQQVAAIRGGGIEPINPAGIDIYSPFPDVDGKGKPTATLTNAQSMLDRLGVTVRYNVVTKEPDYQVPGSSFPADDVANMALALLQSWCVRFRMPSTNFESYLNYIARKNQFNPVADWITSRPWDGVTRLAAFFDTVTEREARTLPDGRRLRDVLLKKWLLSAVAAIFEPGGVVAKGVLTFKGEQNIGKTLWAKRLAPEWLDAISDGVILRPDDRDSVKQAVSNWIVELGEVDATFRKSDIAELKAFITKKRDVLRLPYARAETKMERRTVFFASVNNEGFLRDRTGNTRFWSIDAVALNNAHDIDTQQLWAEVKAIYDASEKPCWFLTKEEDAALSTSNREHEELDPIHDMLDRAFDWDCDRARWTNALRATDLLRLAGLDKPTKGDVNEAASHVVKRYGVLTAKKGKDRSKVWLMPPHMRDTQAAF